RRELCMASSCIDGGWPGLSRTDPGTPRTIPHFGHLVYNGPMSPPLRFRNSHGELVDLQPVPATRFKNEFSAMFEQAALGHAVAITKHDTPKAVLISYEEFRALMEARSPSLGALEAEFDALLGRMQSPASREAM